jgi:hypothetical protein
MFSSVSVCIVKVDIIRILILNILSIVKFSSSLSTEMIKLTRGCSRCSIYVDVKICLYMYKIININSIMDLLFIDLDFNFFLIWMRFFPHLSEYLNKGGSTRVYVRVFSNARKSTWGLCAVGPGFILLANWLQTWSSQKLILDKYKKNGSWFKSI